VFGKGAIQESSVHGVDIVELFRPVTKLSVMLPHSDRGPDILRTAIRAALSGRPGPVHVNLPADLVTRPVLYVPLRPHEYRPVGSKTVDRQAIACAAQLLAEADHPCLLAGHGVALADASSELVEIAHRLRAPVATSPKGKGVFPENDALSLGVVGFGGHERAEEYIQSPEVDVLVVIGSSMNEFVTNGWSLQPKARTLIQIDLDPMSIGKNYPVDVAVLGDARASLREILALLPSRESATHRLTVRPAELSIQPRPSEEAASTDGRRLSPRRIVAEMRRAMAEDAMLFVDTGNSILWATHYFEVRRPNTYYVDLGLGAMGSAVAGIVGGTMAAPGRRAVGLVGDAAFAMHGCEVHTAVEERLPIVWVVLNNGGHGMVHQGDKLMKGKDLGVSQFRVPLDVAGMARAMGARGERAETLDQFRRLMEEALQLGEPFVIDALIDPTEMAPTLERRVRTLARFFGRSLSVARQR
jgi:acetolactate synthase-1/2/3 large subunit